MDGEPTSALGYINRGIARHNDRLNAEAKVDFAQAIIKDPGNELAWIWYSTVSDVPAEQRYCIDRALEINPESPVRIRLRRLLNVTPKIPAELSFLGQPQLPSDLRHVDSRLPNLPLKGIRRRSRVRTGPTPAAGAVQPTPQSKTTEPEPRTTTRRISRRVRWLGVAALGVAILAICVYAFMSAVDEPDRLRIAIVAPTSGPLASTGEEQVRAARLAVKNINHEGGIDGKDLELVVFDDENNADKARARAEEIAADDSILLVIGHNDSNAALAASEVYRAAGIPVISPAAAAAALTIDNPGTYSVVLPTTYQGAFMASYLDAALGISNASVVSTGGTYSSEVAASFEAQFTQTGGTIEHSWKIDLTQQDASIAAIVAELAADTDPGMIVLSMLQPEARAFVLAAKRQGITASMFVSPSLGFDDFPDLFEDEPEEQDQPGYFSSGIYAASSLIYDSIGGNAVLFADSYREAYDTSPDWFGARVYDAITVGARGLELTELADGDASTTRSRLISALASINSTETAVTGLSGPLYFNPDGVALQGLSVGVFDRGHLSSLPVQYKVVLEPALFDLDADRAANRLLDFAGLTLRQYRVVYVGIDLNELSGLDTASQTYTADFFVWLRYSGDSQAADIVFTNAVDPSLSIGEPLQTSELNGQTYEMYRVHGSFTEPLDFHNYPWDVHSLGIGLKNRSLDDNEVVYVADQSTLAQSQEERLQSGFDFSQPLNKIPNWVASRVWFSQESQTSRSIVQDEDTGAPGYVSFSEFRVDVTLERDVQSFLIKNLLPLVLLAAVTYVSLFFSPDQAGSRIGFAITSILTASVLLGSISSRLPDIGYTVAIEWGFYAYIGFSAILVLFNIVVERLYKSKRYGAVKRLDIAARVLYPATVIGMVLVYVVRFG